MFGDYFYHEIIRKTLIGFGTLFNDIHVRHKKSSGEILDDIKVGLSYGPKQKFLSKIQEQEQLTKSIALTLPRMAFEMTTITPDPTRKTTITKTFKAVDGDGNMRKVYMPNPYNIGIELNILSNLNDDSLQIIEQILPYFQPSINITIDLINSIGEKKDIPLVLESIDFQDDYEGDFSTRRILIYTLRFTAKTYLFSDVADTTDGLIRKVQVDMHDSTDRSTSKRVMRYTATPDPVDAAPNSTFSIDEDWMDLGDFKEYSPTRQTDI